MSHTSDTETDDEVAREELKTQLALLEEENQALYESYVHAKQTQYRRTAVGLGSVGGLAVIASLLIQPARPVLLALGGIGLFGSILTLYLTPERVITADTGRAVYTALAENERALVTELGLTDHRVYIPTPDAADPAALFIPHTDEYTLPADTALSDIIVTPDDPASRGIAFTPSGSALFESFFRASSGPLDETPAALGTQLSDALTAQFELVDAVDVESDADNQYLTVTVTGSAYGPLTRFDHPVVSFVATGLARGLGQPVTTEVTEPDDDRFEYRIRYDLAIHADGPTSDPTATAPDAS